VRHGQDRLGLFRLGISHSSVLRSGNALAIGEVAVLGAVSRVAVDTKITIVAPACTVGKTLTVSVAVVGTLSQLAVVTTKTRRVEAGALTRLGVAQTTAVAVMLAFALLTVLANEAWLTGTFGVINTDTMARAVILAANLLLQ